MKINITVIVLGIIITFIIIGLVACTKPMSLSVNQENIASISISVNSTIPKYEMLGSAKITDNEGIKDCIQKINSMKVYLKKDYENESESPAALIKFYDEKRKETDSIYFYYDIILYNQEFYKVDTSEYEKLFELCRKYGELQLNK